MQIQSKVWSRFEENEIEVFYTMGNRPNFLQKTLDSVSVNFATQNIYELFRG